MRLLAMILALSTPVFATDLWTGVIDPARAINWQLAGVTGGIPVGWVQCVTSQCNTVSGGTVTTASVNAAIVSAPNNTFILVPAGTFTISGGIVFNSHNNVILRGLGANTTFLSFSGVDSCTGQNAAVCIRSSDVNYFQQATNVASWTAGYTQGATVITLTLPNPTNLVAGNVIIGDQLADTGNGATNANGAGSIPWVCNADSQGCAFDGSSGTARIGRPQEQLFTVVSCSPSCSTPGSSSVTITPGLYMPNWRSGQTPEVWYASFPIHGVGIENMSLNFNNHGSKGVLFFNAQDSWVSGVRFNGPANGVQYISLSQWNSAHITAQNNYFYGPGGSQEVYGIETFPCADCLFVNNIMQGQAAAFSLNGEAAGTVVAYNYGINPNYTGSLNFQNQMIFGHSSLSHVLIEGNVGTGFYGDEFHGTQEFFTIFRNRFDGNERNASQLPTEHTVPMILYPFKWHFNVIGNVLGGSRPNNIYQSIAGNIVGNENNVVYTLGYTSAGCAGSSPPYGCSDTYTTDSLMRWGNYDTANAAVRFVNAEVPSGIADFPNPVPGSTTLPASFYYATKPLWWPITKAWPPIGPDVTGGNITGVGGHAYTIPAQDCALNIMSMPADGVGSVLAFDAASCYVAVSQSPSANLQGQVSFKGAVALR